MAADGFPAAGSALRPIEVHKLQLILKTVERCNLACPYCYYFFSGDESFRDRPARISRDVITQLGGFLRQAVDDLSIETVEISFHGGEPMLQKLADFDWACGLLREQLADYCRLHLVMQTNGTRLSDAWIETLAKHRVALGVSIDGLAEDHDRNRYYHNGKGSHGDIAAGLKRLSAHPGYGGGAVAVLSVLNAELDYRRIVGHFVDELGLTRLCFLLPDCTHDSGIPEGATARRYGEILCSLFDEWARRPHIHIREVDRFLRRFQKARLSAHGAELEQRRIATNALVLRNHIAVVHSNGDLALDDSYMPAREWRQSAPKANIAETSLAEHLRLPVFEVIYGAMGEVPDACKECIWLGVCGGGDLENRYGSGNGFNNPSVFCEGLQMFYEHAVKYLIANGYPREEIRRRLEGDFDLHAGGYAA
jgi:uncharacterized protein